MPPISSRQLVDVVLRVERMSFQGREKLAGQIHDEESTLFVSVLVLQRHGAALTQIDVVLNEQVWTRQALSSSVAMPEPQAHCLGCGLCAVFWVLDA